MKFVADLVPATRRVVPAGDGETTLDEETALIAAIDRVLDVVSVGWEQLLAQAPELTVRVGSTPESATGGIDLALQFAGTACRRFVARSGASAARIRIFEAAVRERLLLTRPGGREGASPRKPPSRSSNWPVRQSGSRTTPLTKAGRKSSSGATPSGTNSPSASWTGPG